MPEPFVVMPVAPVLPPVIKGRCGVPGCSDRAHLYLCGWRCDRHSPAAMRTGAVPAPVTPAVEAPAASGPPDGWPVPKPTNRTYSPTRQQHTWTKVKEHHRVCGFCLVWVVNQTENHVYWWQTWRWPDETTGTNQGDRYPKMPRCPGPKEPRS